MASFYNFLCKLEFQQNQLMIHLFHLVLNVLTFFFLEMVLIMKNISGQEVKKLIASKQKHEWKRL